MIVSNDQLFIYCMIVPGINCQNISEINVISI